MNTLPTLFAAGISSGAILAILALGFAVSYWPSRQFHFAYGGVFLVASYGLWWATTIAHMPFSLAVLVAGGAAVITSFLCYQLFYNPLHSENGVFLTGFALAIALQYLVQIVFSADPQGVQSPTTWIYNPISLGSIHFSGIQVIEAVTGFGAWLAVAIFLARSKTGIALRALSSDHYLTECVGIRVRRLLAMAYALGAVLVTIAAVIYAVDFGMNPASGNNPLFYAINGTLLGGLRSINGAALGGLLLGILTNVGIWLVPSEWQDGIAFGFLLVVLLFRPHGLLAQEG